MNRRLTFVTKHTAQHLPFCFGVRLLGDVFVPLGILRVLVVAMVMVRGVEGAPERLVDIK